MKFVFVTLFYPPRRVLYHILEDVTFSIQKWKQQKKPQTKPQQTTQQVCDQDVAHTYF